MKRIFVAVPISPVLQGQILSWEEGYLMGQPSFAKATAGKVRWLQGKNLHITLIPPWHVDEKELEIIMRRLKDFKSDIQSLTLSFSRVAYGSDPRAPRLIWAEGQTPPTIVDLKSRLEEYLGQKSERRSFLLHLTLARFRPENFSQFPLKNLDAKVDWSEKAESIVLMESHLAPGGADYEVLMQTEL